MCVFNLVYVGAATLLMHVHLVSMLQPVNPAKRDRHVLFVAQSVPPMGHCPTAHHNHITRAGKVLRVLLNSNNLYKQDGEVP